MWSQYLDCFYWHMSWMIISVLCIYLLVATSMCVVPVLDLIWTMAWLRYASDQMWEMFSKFIVRYNSALTCSISFIAAAEPFWEISCICVPPWNFPQLHLLISVPWPWPAQSQIRFCWLYVNLFNSSVIWCEAKRLWSNSVTIPRCTEESISLLK